MMNSLRCLLFLRVGAQTTGYFCICIHHAFICDIPTSKEGKESLFQHLKIWKADVSTRGGDSYMKQTEMLFVSLRGIKFGFWSRLGCSGQSANILSRQGLVYGSAKKHRITRRETEVKFSFFIFFFFFKQSLLGVELCFSHAQIGLL